MKHTFITTHTTTKMPLAFFSSVNIKEKIYQPAKIYQNADVQKFQIYS